MDKITFSELDLRTRIGNVQYGTIVTGITGHPNSVYMKVNKHEVSQNMHLGFNRNISILVNLRTGSLRDVPGNSTCTIWQENLDLTPPENEEDFLK